MQGDTADVDGEREPMYDGDTFSIDLSLEEPYTAAIYKGLNAHVGEAALEESPIHDSISPEAINGLFAWGETDHRKVEFRHLGHLVTVHGEGVVEISAKN